MKIALPSENHKNQQICETPNKQKFASPPENQKNQQICPTPLK